MQWTQRGAHPIFQPVALTIICLTAGCSRQNETRSEIARPVKTMVVTAGDRTAGAHLSGKGRSVEECRACISGTGFAGQTAGQGRTESRQRRDDRPTPAGRISGAAEVRAGPTRSGSSYPQRTPAWGAARRATAAGSAVEGGRGEAGERQDGIRSLRKAGQDECRLTRGIRTG